MVSPGSEAPRVLDLFIEARGEPERRWCLACATAAGFPWLASETPRADKRNATRMGLMALQGSKCDATHKTPAADLGATDAGRQDYHTSAVGRGASRRGRRLAPALGVAA